MPLHARLASCRSCGPPRRSIEEGPLFRPLWSLLVLPRPGCMVYLGCVCVVCGSPLQELKSAGPVGLRDGSGRFVEHLQPRVVSTTLFYWGFALCIPIVPTSPDWGQKRTQEGALYTDDDIFYSVLLGAVSNRRHPGDVFLNAGVVHDVPEDVRMFTDFL